SAKLGEVGNVVLFGHSSYLPVVLNQSYKVFNGIQKLVDGDIITVYSSSTIYTYRVRGAVTKSTNDANIPLDVPGRVLTLVTSDSFDTKIYHRFIITADFVESRPLEV
ncbi:MAG: sortase, partial [Candidatus Roizmanbacteria bacterium]|nr:sortase [Candidatus Roizmanbacteria bacterium]